MPKPEEYIGIQAWGSQMGSHAYYIKDEQARAATDGAPLDVIFREYDANGPTGKWATVSELAPGHSFHAVYERALHAAGRTA